ncbi:MAG: M6 family metalloprotease domain-containing protein, partial [Prevotella sp.]|nr:M6 family metalloprotease domain-containing protein [Prevotella sp.]
MKRRILASFVLVLMATAANAVPARPNMFRTLKLSDGTTVEARLVGDEFGHYWLTKDGRTFRNTKSGFTPIDKKKVDEKAQKRRSAANQHRAKRQAWKARPQLMAAQNIGQIGKYVGEKKGLIILVEYKDDHKFQPEHNQALYNRIANEKGFNEGDFVGSVYDYFLAQSEGLFQLTFDVVGPYTLDHERAYYGGNDKNDDDEHPAEMVIEACKQADADVDFADYDWDGDGEVDQVFVLYAGNGEANYGDKDSVWPHEWTLSDAHGYGDGEGAITLDDVTIDTYACSNELQPAKFDRNYNVTAWKIEGIGTICHEFSHCFGYPDFYDTNGQNSGMGYWDLMDNGSYNGENYNGCCPAGFTSYERWVAGWKEPIELKEDTEVTGMKSLQDGGDTYIIYNDGHRDEFFLLENRQWTSWDDQLPGKGLLILHVDYDEDAWWNNEVNDTKNHERMTWIAADNKKIYKTYDGARYYDFDDMKNDPYPYKTNNSFTNSSVPAATVFNKNTDGSKKLNKSVKEITQNSDGTISFKFEASAEISSIEKPTVSSEVSPRGIFDLQGRK